MPNFANPSPKIPNGTSPTSKELFPYLPQNQTKEAFKLIKEKEIKPKNEQKTFNSIDMRTRNQFRNTNVNQNQTFTRVKNTSIPRPERVNQSDKFLTARMSAKYTQNKRIFRSPGAPARNDSFQNTPIKEEKSNQKSSFCKDRNIRNGFFSPKPKCQSIFFVDLKKKSQDKGRRKFKLRKKDSS